MSPWWSAKQFTRRYNTLIDLRKRVEDTLLGDMGRAYTQILVAILSCLFCFTGPGTSSEQHISRVPTAHLPPLSIVKLLCLGASHTRTASLRGGHGDSSSLDQVFMQTHPNIACLGLISNVPHVLCVHHPLAYIHACSFENFDEHSFDTHTDPRQNSWINAGKMSPAWSMGRISTPLVSVAACLLLETLKKLELM